ncbi:MAG: RtcB family protein [Clostridiales bacterium]|jgi:tRNA-splicing ligase RtcB|nr:RtcB family protein [Clostridiales bacterium]
MPEMILQGPNRYLLPKTGAMLVDALLFLNDNLRRSISGEGMELRQLCDAAALPGVIGPVIGLPDIHAGFGLPIGGVMACCADSGVVSAGAVGMDINCGVRLLSTNIPSASLDKRTLRKLMEAVEVRIPTGIGRKSRHRELCLDTLPQIMSGGVGELIARGYGRPDDKDYIEESGCLGGADVTAVSKKAMERAGQLSTLGGGNHFLEFGTVDWLPDQETDNFGLHHDMLTVLIHTGSRGFGHQICTDYTEIMAAAAPRYGIELPSKGLACCPIHSKEGRDYLAAMACAVNFAFANRQLITYDIREAFREVLGGSDQDFGLNVVYDVAHNIAKFEEHFGRRALVHRKGATRALPPGHPINPDRYKDTGHPAIIPGSMNSPSYLVTGTAAVSETFHSVNHGAGRTLSRSAARKTINHEAFTASIGNVMLNTRDYKQLFDEAPLAYKDINDVVETLAEIGLTRKVARLKPLAVIKGEGDD